MLDQSRLDRVVDEVARITGRNVTLDDVFSKVLAYNTSFPTTDRARMEAVLMKSVSAEARVWEAEGDLASRTRPFILPARPEVGFLARVCIPLVHRGLKTGYLWVATSDHNDPPEPILEVVLALGDRIEKFSSAVREAIEPATQESVARERALLAALREPGRHEELWLSDFLEDGPAQVGVLTHPTLYRRRGAPGIDERTTLLRHAMSEALRAVSGRVVWAPAGNCVVALFGPEIGRVDVSSVMRRFSRVVSLHSVPGLEGSMDAAEMGMAGKAGNVMELGIRFREALVALQARTVDPALPEVSTYESVGIYQFLSQLDQKAKSSRLSAIEASSKGHDQLELLERLYDSDKPRNELAADLHIHRTSLYHRLRSIGKIIDDDPLSSHVRLDLHVALKAQRWARRPRLFSWDTEPADLQL